MAKISVEEMTKILDHLVSLGLLEKIETPEGQENEYKPTEAGRLAAKLGIVPSLN